MWVKILIVLVLLMILASLASGMIYMLRDRGNSERAVKALTVRIGLSVTLFVLLMIAFATGMIQPHGLFPPQP
ncbi:MAG: twin transmembrane helix small protein [Gammaproteobacteria bacterium]|nr:twin transmembrane helix small protein [Gammaproteobacteria bacterium]MCP5135706.1 twin transmembrane helix small protein [Gammaproteobacteria bacterium]